MIAFGIILNYVDAFTSVRMWDIIIHNYLLEKNVVVPLLKVNDKERQVEGIKRAKAEGKYKGRVPTAMRQADKVKALVEAGVARVLVMEQLGISKASYYRCLQNAA